MKPYFKKMTPAQNVYKIYAKYIEKVNILFFYCYFWMLQKYENVIFITKFHILFF